MSETNHGVEGLAFVGCMFIGGGVGLAFGRAEVGGAIGIRASII